MSGTNDTSFEPSKLEGGCPCGRSHPAAGVCRRQRRRPRPHGELAASVYDAVASGKAEQDAGTRIWRIGYAGDCQKPLPVSANADSGQLFAKFMTRCRKCNACLRAKRNYWGFAAMNMTLSATNAGLRTWFGTLTLDPAMQVEFKQRAYERWAMSHTGAAQPEWWDDPKCDERFRLVRDELLLETQKYWKRLRKAGHRFKYFLVFERHKSGLPHMHFLLHEQDRPIRKRELQAQWPFGFTNVSIVGGKSAKAAAPERAAWYVSKYLSKSVQSRQVASRLYRPEGRALARTYRRPPPIVVVENPTCNKGEKAARSAAKTTTTYDDEQASEVTTERVRSS